MLNLKDKAGSLVKGDFIKFIESCARHPHLFYPIISFLTERFKFLPERVRNIARVVPNMLVPMKLLRPTS
jgi:hypothetical protein